MIKIIAGNKKNWIGDIIFLNTVKKNYFILPFYNLYVFKVKIINKNFESAYVYNEGDLLFDQNLILSFEKNLSFINSIKYIEQKNNSLISRYRKLTILKNLKYCILVDFSNVLFLKDTTNFLKKITSCKLHTNLKINFLKKSGFTLVEIKKIFLN
jgi:hypothetical protein